MLTTYSRTRGRAGMTLIEILVVIAIIAILAALITAGVMGVMRKGPEAQARSEISNLAIALQKFKTDYGFYPPDQLKLHATYSQYNPNNALDAQSMMYLGAMFPNSKWIINPNAAIPWAGATPMGAGYVLDGDQCLVFFLGGPPVGGLPLPPLGVPPVPLLGGFSVNPQDPVSLGTTLSRKKYYDFNEGRLYLRYANNPFPSYRDAWPAQGADRPASPYVYFSAGKSPANAYVYSATITFTIPVKGVATNFLVSPYKSATGNFYNQNTFQILSAGLDGQFGPGGLWPPVQPVVHPAPVGTLNPGIDDFSNFSSAQLGAGVTN